MPPWEPGFDRGSIWPILLWHAVWCCLAKGTRPSMLTCLGKFYSAIAMMQNWYCHILAVDRSRHRATFKFSTACSLQIFPGIGIVLRLPLRIGYLRISPQKNFLFQIIQDVVTHICGNGEHSMSAPISIISNRHQ